MTKFETGDRVKIRGTEFTGTVHVSFEEDRLVSIDPDPAPGIPTEYRTVGIPAVWLEHAEPHSWPPQVGDIWVTCEETEFYVTAHGARSWLKPMRAEDGLSYAVDVGRDMEKFLALNPSLVRRRGVH